MADRKSEDLHHRDMESVSLLGTYGILVAFLLFLYAVYNIIY